MFNGKSFKCRCTNFENNCSTEYVFLQVNMINDMLQTLLVASHQQQLMFLSACLSVTCNCYLRIFGGISDAKSFIGKDCFSNLRGLKGAK